MPQKRVSFVYRLQYALFLMMLGLVRIAPLWLLEGVRRGLVFLFRRFDRRHPALISQNLRMAFPKKSNAEIDTIADAIYRHFSSVLFDILRTVARRQGASRVVREARVVNMASLLPILERGRGLIVFSAHYGNWEWIPPLLSAHLQRPVNVIARPLDNPLIEKRLRRFRESLGSQVIYKQGSLRRILDKLAANEVVFLLIDQNTVTREGTFIDFFSRKASAVTSVSRLYLKKRIPIVPVFLCLQGNGRSELRALAEIRYRRTGNETGDIAGLTQHLNSIIEDQIRSLPEQWFWFHDRWRTQPQGDNDEKRAAS